MIISINKFGFVLTSRESGKEAFAAFLPTLTNVKENEEILLDFTGTNAVSPSWADEFITPLYEKFGARLKLKKTANPSVSLTLEMLEKIHGYRLEIV